MTPNFRHLGLATLVCASGLLGQAPAPTSVIPAGPLLTMHIDGPAALRATFLPTNLGKMFAGPEFKDMLAPFMQMYEGMKEQGADQMPFDPNAFEKAFLGYRGRLSAAIHLLDDNIDFNAPEPPDFAVTIVLSPDGKTDLAAMCAQVKEIAGGMLGDRLGSVEVAGKTLRYVEEDGDPSFCLPFMHNGHAVLLLSQNMERAGKAVLAAEKLHSTGPQFAKASMGVSINAERIMALLKKGAADQAGPMWDSVGSHIFNRSGLLSMKAVEMTYRADGPAVVSESVLEFNPGDRGILGMFFPVQAGKTSLVDILPRDAVSASAMPFDLKKLYTVVEATFADMGDDAPMSFEDFLDQFKDNMGLRLKEDLLDTFGNGVLSAQMPSDNDPDPMNPLSQVDGLCIGFQMADGAKFSKSLDSILRANGLHAGRKKTEYKGNDIFSMNIMMMLDLNYAVSDKLFLLGIGEGSGAAIRSILDESKNIAGGNEPTPLPKPVLERLKMNKGGWSGLGWSDLEGVMDSLMGSLDAVASELPPQLSGVLDMMEKMPALFKNYKVKHQVAVIQAQGNRWIYKSIW